ncbi:hypothetical protein [Jannaschia rubra]|uniref:Uncharacterized protein n=1 Tax=Jannaschia rubra TaxID=282197 RepID=A0A0M6XQP3_9RHOB|nr:hypothetical protein [Jannaschia rubra]CTQ32992.1 hypothetical protein JAN5088_01767 [Jannaschia rubra]SFG59291.1 hypothetical protein SAMN04488517_10762 [Jannaschia rubra]
MTHKIKTTLNRVEAEPVMDVLAGVWLVTLLLSLLHLPSLVV